MKHSTMSQWCPRDQYSPDRNRIRITVSYCIAVEKSLNPNWEEQKTYNHWSFFFFLLHGGANSPVTGLSKEVALSLELPILQFGCLSPFLFLYSTNF